MVKLLPSNYTVYIGLVNEGIIFSAVEICTGLMDVVRVYNYIALLHETNI